MAYSDITGTSSFTVKKVPIYRKRYRENGEFSARSGPCQRSDVTIGAKERA